MKQLIQSRNFQSGNLISKLKLLLVRLLEQTSHYILKLLILPLTTLITVY